MQSRPHPSDEVRMDTQPAEDNYDLLLQLRYSGLWFESRFDSKGAPQDLDRAVSVMEKVIAITPSTQSDRVYIVQHLHHLLDKRYDFTRSSSDLNRSIDLWEEVVGITSASDPDWIPILSCLTRALLKRFNAARAKYDIDRLIEIMVMKVAATPENHYDRASRLADQAFMLEQRYDLTKAVEDLHEAVNLRSLAIAAVSPDHPKRTDVLLGYAKLLAKRSKATASFHDLDDAIDISNAARSAISAEHPSRAHCEHTHSVLLHMRFAQTGTRESLDAAIQTAELSAKALSKNSPRWFFYQATVAKLLVARFGSRGSLQDLDRAIALLEEAVENAAHDDPYRLDNMTYLSNSLGRRFQETGIKTDIDRAVEISSRVVASTSNDNPFHTRHLANLGNLAGPRYERTGLIDDLNLAIDVLEKAVLLPPHLLTKTAQFPHAPVGKDYNEGGLRASLGHWLAERFDRTAVMADLERSIFISEQAIAKTPSEDKVNYGNQSYFLSRRLRKLFEEIREPSVIARAIEVARVAVKNTPDGHPYKSAHLANLAHALFSKYTFDDVALEEDIEEAITLGMKALDLTDTDQASGAMAFAALGKYYEQRFVKTEKGEHLDEALLYFNQAVSCANSPPNDRADSAQHAARIYADQGKWTEACSMLEIVMELLPLVSPRLLNNSDKQHQISPFSGLASFAAAMALQAGKDALHALQLLEAGRGLIGASLAELRSDISELRREYPEIAQKLDELRVQLDSRNNRENGIGNGMSFEGQTQGTKLGEADEKLTNLIMSIRDLPGFEGFLLPPSREDFLVAADRGPIVVINMNHYRCDALLIRKDRVWSIDLPNLKEADINDRLKERDRKRRQDSIRSSDTLEWLWNVAVEPILIELGYTTSPLTDVWDQVWWVLTSRLSWFPIHAAGKHTSGKLESTLDRVMSSYSTSVKSLINGRSSSVHNAVRPASKHALLVAMQKTIGYDNLPCANQEVEMLAALAPSLNLEAVIPPERRKANILRELKECKVFHFAGHGKTNPTNPEQSLLLLDDWQDDPLTVEDLRNLNMHEHAPFLAFLSACSTSANERIQLIDEGVHLAGSLQLAGFRHVIGTLWAVLDDYCVEISRTVYETLRNEGMTDATVCRAVHKAVRKMREESLQTYGRRRDADLSDDSEAEAETRPHPKPELDTYWIPYVHFGV